MSKKIKETLQTLRNRYQNDASGMCDKAYGEGYLEALEHVEKALQELIESEASPTLLEQSGYSYSGIAELIRDNPERAKAYIQELHTARSEAMEQERKATYALNAVQRQLALLHQSYRHVHRILNVQDDQFCYTTNGMAHVVTVTEDRVIVESRKIYF